MTVRRRILLAALAVGVVGTLVVLIWSSGPKDSTPKLGFTLRGYTTTTLVPAGNNAKLATITVTNCGDHPATLERFSILFESERFEPLHIASRERTNIAPGHAYTMTAIVYIDSASGSGLDGFGSTTDKWRLRCYVDRPTLANKLRRTLQRVPWIGYRVDPTNGYGITSDTFTQ